MRILKKRGLCGGLKRNRMGNSEKIFCIIAGFLLCFGHDAFTQPVSKGDVIEYERLAESIFYAEGGYKTHYFYGIKSVSCETKDECRIKCIESVRNQFKLFTRHGGKGVKNFIREFARRYDSGDSRAGQAVWIKNVTRIYYKQGVLHGRK